MDLFKLTKAEAETIIAHEIAHAWYQANATNGLHKRMRVQPKGSAVRTQVQAILRNPDECDLAVFAASLAYRRHVNAEHAA